MRKIAIIGGGAAGIAAAIKAAQNGFRTTLYEARPVLGGRIASFTDKKSGLKFNRDL